MFHLGVAILLTVMMASAPALGSDLAAYRWENRLLLVFAPSDSNAGYVSLNRALDERDVELKDRDLVVFRVFESGPSRRGEEPLSSADAEALRRRFEVRNGGLTVILIGKDGAVKMTRESGVALQEIFALIDSMPMRRREMREKSGRR